MSKRLIISDGKRERSLVLFDQLIVGRDPACDVTHEDDLLSRRHAEFVVSADTVTVRDLGSRNGIYVNGLKTAERPIYPGDVVQIGPLRILYAHHVPPAGIVPEYVVPDRAMPGHRPSTPPMIQMQSSSPPTPWPPPPTPLGAKAPAADEEQTQVLAPVHPGASPSTPTAAAQTPAAAHSFQDGPTQFIAPRQASAAVSPSATRISPAAAPRQAPAAASAAPATPPRPWQSPASPPAKSEPSLEPPPTVELTIDQTRIAPLRPPARSVDSDLKGYVFTHATAIAVVALLSAVVPLSIVRADALGVWLAIPVVLTIATTYLAARAINRRFARIVRALKPDGALGGEPSRGSRGGSSDLFRS